MIQRKIDLNSGVRFVAEYSRRLIASDSAKLGRAGCYILEVDKSNKLGWPSLAKINVCPDIYR